MLVWGMEECRCGEYRACLVVVVSVGHLGSCGWFKYFV